LLGTVPKILKFAFSVRSY